METDAFAAGTAATAVFVRSRGQSRDETTRETARAGSDQSALASSASFGDVLGDALGNALGDVRSGAHSVAHGVAPGDAHGYAHKSLDAHIDSLSDLLGDAHDASSISTKETGDCIQEMMLATAQALPRSEDTCGETGTDCTLIVDTVCRAPQAARPAPVLGAAASVPTGPATCASSRVHQPASLVELCEKRLLRFIRCSQDAAAVLDVAELLGNDALKQESRRSLERLFPVLAEKEDTAALRAVLGEERVAALEDDLRQQREARQEMASRRSGTIVQPAGPDASVVPDAQGMYPLEVLVRGVQWPADVDPTAREQRLPDAQFEQLFGMPKTAFNALPLFKRTRLKKDKALF